MKKINRVKAQATLKLARGVIQDLREAFQRKRLGTEAPKIARHFGHELTEQFPNEAKTIRKWVKLSEKEIQKLFLHKHSGGRSSSQRKTKNSAPSKAEKSTSTSESQ